MRTSTFFKMALVAIPLALACCKSSKDLEAPKPLTQEQQKSQEVRQKGSDNGQVGKLSTT